MYLCTGSILWVGRYLFVHVNRNLSENLELWLHGDFPIKNRKPPQSSGIVDFCL